ncbi:MAG: hypothetical protein Q9165_003925 [Trypethelium subeluteriae]
MATPDPNKTLIKEKSIRASSEKSPPNATTTPRPIMATIQDDDERLLARIGYKQELKLAELVSAYPTAGGMYFVTKHVVPKEHVAIWAWIIGWCNFLGQAAGVASLAYTIAQLILAGATMNSTFIDGTYSYTPYAQHYLFALTASN